MAANHPRCSTEQEKNLLLKLVVENEKVILSKKINQDMIMKKARAWDRITEAYNRAGMGPQKSCRQLKRMWEHHKSKTKKYNTALKKEPVKTGDESPPEDADDKTTFQLFPSPETSVQLKQKEHEMDMKIKENEIACLEMELELKEMRKKILDADIKIKELECNVKQLAISNTQLKHQAVIGKIELVDVWKEAGIAVRDAAVALKLALEEMKS